MKFMALFLVRVNHNLHLNIWLCAESKNVSARREFKLILKLPRLILVVLYILTLLSRAINDLKLSAFAIKKIS